MSNSNNPPKRAACDRCRTQKLRCVRAPGHPADSCIRCIRSQMECVTSSSKRPGRPRNSTTASRQTTGSTRTRSNNDDTHSPRNPSPSLPTVDLHALTSVDDWFNLELLDADYEMSHAPWNSIDVGFPIDGSATIQTMSSPSTPPDEPSPAALLNDPMMDTSPTEHLPLLQLEPIDPGLLPLFGDHLPPPTFDHGLHLSVLQRELSKQLFTLRSMPWDMTKAMWLTCLHEAGGCDSSTQPSPPDLQITTTNPLAKIARTAADFAQFLRSIQASPSSEITNSHHLATKAPASSNTATALAFTHPRLSITDLLTILSCHLLTISIYDTIFGHFIEQARLNPTALNLATQAAPKLFLGGIAVPPGLGMLSHLLYCLTGSQLRPIEMLLGLPEEFCLSSPRTGLDDTQQKPEGLFSGSSGHLLFSTLMQVELDAGNAGGGRERGGLGVIEALRGKMRRVRCLD
ncbi:hypothetical protein ASPACDRAFT_59432 [Aspergillus aculeatus ATCC 16872]|uniref:Zn(2)-C6 fungal-type domain-containing protein n=1 Tax=Aspergillus aculeatus (strain ATCC 16872 / CBS 172.66 / WB 5094) TaxID=690307 RepID=A0A1L9X107_ASPA1|nr:uncharacterized protein ASPACDRAFT_59432 [Aspergillus aculeatus ATCC 16872]OJK01798.1 hypothetical protein ASPACDRAFT_59432 [Aspergillus aculeatus ATCC 16872]